MKKKLDWNSILSGMIILKPCVTAAVCFKYNCQDFQKKKKINFQIAAKLKKSEFEKNMFQQKEWVNPSRVKKRLLLAIAEKTDVL